MKKSLFVISIFSIVCILFVGSCKKNEAAEPSNSGGPSLIPVTDVFTQRVILSQSVVVNSSGFAPLTALIRINTSEPTKARIKVVGKNGSSSDVTKDFDTVSTNYSLTVLGLYPDYANVVQLTLFGSEGQNLGTSAINIHTGPLSADLPSITINSSSPGKREGMTLVSYLASTTTSAPVIPFIFDAFGDIRWYLDYKTSPTLKKLNYDNGVERLKNGNLYFGDINSGTIYEVNMLGEIINSWPLPGYIFHHKVLEKPDGNFLVTVTKLGLNSVRDHILEIDRNSKQIIHIWDLRQSLQMDRMTFIPSATTDWIHVNAIEYDASDNTIIVSGRVQGLFKIDQNNKVLWVMGVHKGWGLAGDKTDLNTKLLQPLDSKGKPITDTSVLHGYTNHPDFEWNWCQHAAKLTPWGNITMFDNGDQRNFTNPTPYSRAAEFKINPTDMTVQQIWQYGKERGQETFSKVVSDVDYHSDVNHIIMSPGAVNNGVKYGKVIELVYKTSTVLFEATIYPPIASSKLVTFHRTERLSLYAN